MSRFRAPTLPLAAALAVVALAAPAAMIWPLYPVLPSVTVALAVFFLILYVSVLQKSLAALVLDVDEEGIRFPRTRRILWYEVTAARRRTILLLPHLELRRRRGLRWWIPLYLHGPTDLRAALRDAAPPDHPVRYALSDRAGASD